VDTFVHLAVCGEKAHLLIDIMVAAVIVIKKTWANFARVVLQNMHKKRA